MPRRRHTEVGHIWLRGWSASSEHLDLQVVLGEEYDSKSVG